MGDYAEGMDILIRLGVSILIGGLIGLERQLHGRWAGMRTHMMVSMGAAMFTIAGLEVAKGDLPDTTRVIQGIAAGIGFLGAGTILKLSNQLEVKGLTTASAIWLTAANGTATGLGHGATGLGHWWLAGGGTVGSLLILALLRPIDKWFTRDRSARATNSAEEQD